MEKSEFELLGEGYLRLGWFDQAKLAFDEAGRETRKLVEPMMTRVVVAMKAYQRATLEERLLIKGDQCLADGDLMAATVFYEKAEAM